MNSERRHHSRKVSDAPVHVQLSLDNSGNLLNLSEEGLGFQAIAPVHRNGPIFCWFSFETGERIEAAGELAWMDETNKMGGLRFTAITDQARERIGNWVGRGFAPQAASDRPKSQVTPIDASAAVRLPEPLAHPAARARASANPHPQLHSLFDVPLSSAVTTAEAFAPSVPPPCALNTTELVPVQRHLAVTRWRFISGVLIGIASTALVAVPILRIQAQRPGVTGSSDSRTLPPANTAEKGIPGAAPPSLGTVPNARNSSADASSTAKLKTRAQPARASEDPFNLTPATPASPRNAQPPFQKGVLPAVPVVSRSSQSAPAAPSGLSAAPQDAQPQMAATRRNGQPSADQLWAAFQAGSTTAAVTLADRYIAGDGVGKNCEQARILLTVASKKGSAAARRKLQELESAGCAQP
jgi:PilZ domain-containing protein